MGSLIRELRRARRLVVALPLVALIAAGSASADPVGIVRGIVHDPQHRPVPGATVALSAARAEWKQTTYTDANGEFQFVGVPVGDYTIAVTLQGFEPATEAITVV